MNFFEKKNASAIMDYKIKGWEKVKDNMFLSWQAYIGMKRVFRMDTCMKRRTGWYVHVCMMWTEAKYENVIWYDVCGDGSEGGGGQWREMRYDMYVRICSDLKWNVIKTLIVRCTLATL